MEDKIHQKTDELCGNIDKTVTIIKRDIKEIKEYILAQDFKCAGRVGCTPRTQMSAIGNASL